MHLWHLTNLALIISVFLHWWKLAILRFPQKSWHRNNSEDNAFHVVLVTTHLCRKPNISILNCMEILSYIKRTYQDKRAPRLVISKAQNRVIPSSCPAIHMSPCVTHGHIFATSDPDNPWRSDRVKQIRGFFLMPLEVQRSLSQMSPTALCFSGQKWSETQSYTIPWRRNADTMLDEGEGMTRAKLSSTSKEKKKMTFE